MTRQPVLAPRPSIGLDLGSDEATACWLDRAGEVVHTTTLRLEATALADAFSGRPPHAILLEASTPSRWVAELLQELGHDVRVCNPRKLKMIAASTLKTDALDAQVLARLARLAQFDPKLVPGIELKSRSTQLKRSCLALRDQAVSSRTRHVATVRNVLRGDGIKPPSCDAVQFTRRIKGMELPEDIREAIGPTLAIIDEINLQVDVLDRRIRDFAKELPVIAKLQEIDGVGALTATAFVLTIEDSNRFEHARDVAPYVGLVPVVRQSSSQERRGSCNKQGDPRLRRYLVQAALCLLRSRKKSHLQTWGLRICERRGRKKGIVAVARKLAVVMLAIWKTGTDYQPYPPKGVRRKEVHAVA